MGEQVVSLTITSTNLLANFASHPCDSDLYWFGEKNNSFWVHTNVFTELENKTATYLLIWGSSRPSTNR